MERGGIARVVAHVWYGKEKCKRALGRGGGGGGAGAGADGRERVIREWRMVEGDGWVGREGRAVANRPSYAGRWDGLSVGSVFCMALPREGLLGRRAYVWLCG